MSRVIFSLFLSGIVCVAGYYLYKGNSRESHHKVVVSISPLKMIADEILKGVGSAKVLMDTGASPHDFALKPSDMKAIKSADVVFWIGPQLEHGLTRSLSLPYIKDKVAALMDLELPLKLKKGDHACCGGHSHDHAHNHAHDNTHHHSHGHNDSASEQRGHDLSYDPHIWLSSENVEKIAIFIKEKLTEVDPKYASKYRKNLALFLARLKQVSTKIKVQLSKHKDKKFAVYHDAYKYFQHSFNLTAPLVLTSNPEQSLKIAAKKHFKSQLKEQNIKCMFVDPQFPKDKIAAYAQEAGLHLDVIDPVGKSDASYVEFLAKISQTMTTCFERAP